jgi:XTP/dITP diphosphohydrolase
VGTVERGSSGFGYDPLFFPLLPGRILSELTFAQMPSGEKHGLSHRGKALERLSRILSGALPG